MRAIRTEPKARPLFLAARTAADLMSPNVVSIGATADVQAAARFLTDKGVSAAPVINEAGVPVGVVSQTDLVVHARERRAAVAARYDCVDPDAGGGWRDAAIHADFEVETLADPTRVCDVMTPTVFAVELGAPAERVVEEMLAMKVHRLFVTDAGGVLVGVISALDVLRGLRSSE